MSRPAIALEGLDKRFKGARVDALSGITARALTGQVTGIVGPDGAGKTTLLRLLAGLLRPSAGTIWTAPTDGPPVPGRLGYMPQQFGLYEDLSVAENLRLYADLHALAAGERRQRTARLLDFTGLAPFTGRLAGRLSGGMKQKLGLACMLVAPPEVLLLDEPGVGVDPLSRRELWEIVRGLTAEGMTVLWSTAYLDEAGNCDRVWMLDAGKLIAEGPPGDFLAEMRGRCYRMPLPDQGRRHVQARAARAPGVLDAQVRGSGLRLVLAPEARPPEARSVGATGPAEAVPPSFEDAVMARLRAQGAEADAETWPAPQRAEAAAAARADGPAIETRGLTKRFGDFTAVEGVTFRVPAGEIFGLLGPNGAGKSTTFRMLCGLLPATSGEARVAGFDLAHARAEARGRIGYMSQSFSLYGDLSVAQNLRFFAGVYGLAGQRARAAIGQALESFGLGPHAPTSARALPLGFKQRLGLACALLHEPEILFLDEPTSGVDPLTRREFWERINALAEGGVTVLVTSHLLDEAEYCDRLAIMHQSRVIATGAPDEIKRAHAGGPDASLEDAFINLIAGQSAEDAEAAPA